MYSLEQSYDEINGTIIELCVGESLRFKVYADLHLRFECYDNPEKIPGFMIEEISSALGYSAEDVARAAVESYRDLWWTLGEEEVMDRYPWIDEEIPLFEDVYDQA